MKGLSSLTGRQPVLPLSFINLKETFRLNVTFYTEMDFNRTVWRSYDEALNRFDIKYTIQSILNINGSKNIVLDGYFHSYLYFENIKESLRKELTFNKDIITSARHFLEQIILKPNAITVAIHLRLKDKIYWQQAGLIFPPPGYFRKAMEYFLSRDDHVYFIVSSDGTNTESRNRLPSGFDYVFVHDKTPYMDLAILASCDHIIISRGTFSWWAGWLNRGITIYYKYNHLNYNESSSVLDSYMPKDKYNHWIPMRH
ncbi:hypothetical protein LSH36_46g05008 [Paralvinella palmiformis]|uniref:L-Fucosyltransferase n=1 Tax=Paralvinella palmiformis TaxID=53620 RepID=A0AAD9K6C0_9ANNE|nr:hypothetical protein LSH36_46g05008 [Paralvinella palmiformis]